MIHNDDNDDRVKVAKKGLAEKSTNVRIIIFSSSDLNPSKTYNPVGVRYPPKYLIIELTLF